MTEYLVFVPIYRNGEPIHRWEDVLGHGQALDWAGYGSLEYDVKRLCIQGYTEMYPGKYPLVARRTYDHNEATHVINKNGLAGNGDGFEIWAINDQSAPLDHPDTMFVVAQELELKVETKDFEFNHRRRRP